MDANADPPQALVSPQHWGLPQQPVPDYAGAGLHHADQPAVFPAQAGQAFTGMQSLAACNRHCFVDTMASAVAQT